MNMQEIHNKKIKKYFLPIIFFLLFFLASAANAVTTVQDPSNGETNLYLVINQMMGTSFTSSQDSALTDLEVINNDWWHEWDGYISIVATYAGYDQNLYWENDSGSELIHAAALDGIHFYENNPITFQTTGGDFYFKDMTSGGSWYSREDKNSDGKTHMITYAFGNGVFICAVEDVSGLGDQDYNDLIFKIVYGAAPVTVPAISYIPNQAVSAGYPFTAIHLDDYVRDDDGVSEIIWSGSGSTNISVGIDPDTRTATITYPQGWTGSETITFTATDPDGHFDTQQVTFKVNPPDAPVVNDISDQAVKTGKSFSPIHLDDYVSHPAPDIDDSDMIWTASGGSNISVFIDGNRVATMTYPNGWIGSETITFTATVNPSDSDNVTFTVLSAGHAGGDGENVGGIALPVDKFDLIAPWIGLMMFVIAIFVSVWTWKKKRNPTIFTCLLTFILFFYPNATGQTFEAYGSRAKAAIVDHLSISYPNPGFVNECKDILEGAGYDVDYYKGEQVTVELYRNLPTFGYKVILLRVHSAYIHQYLSLAMFTSEPYSKKRYVYEQLCNRVASGYIEPYRKGDPRYLVITDKFVRFSMERDFNDALIIMMGCTGIKKCAATAFLERGARAYIGWDGLVSARHTDRTTIQLLKCLFVERKNIVNAVTQTMKDVGREPQYNSTLLFWPIDAGKYMVQNVYSLQTKLEKGD